MSSGMSPAVGLQNQAAFSAPTTPTSPVVSTGALPSAQPAPRPAPLTATTPAPMQSPAENTGRLSKILTACPKEAFAIGTGLASGVLGAVANSDTGMAPGALIGTGAGYLAHQLLSLSTQPRESNNLSLKEVISKGLQQMTTQDAAVYVSLVGAFIGGLADGDNGAAAGAAFGGLAGAATQKTLNYFLSNQSAPDQAAPTPQRQSVENQV